MHGYPNSQRVLGRAADSCRALFLVARRSAWARAGRYLSWASTVCRAWLTCRLRSYLYHRPAQPV